MELIGDYSLVRDVIEKFSDFDGLTAKDCEELGITDEAGQVLRAAIADGVIKNQEKLGLKDYFTKKFVTDLAGRRNQRPLDKLYQSMEYVVSPLKLPGYPKELPSDPSLVELVHGKKGFRTEFSNWIPALMSIAVYDDDWRMRDSAAIALSWVGPQVLPKLFETSVEIMTSEEHRGRFFHLFNLSEVYDKFGETSAKFLTGKLELSDFPEQAVAAHALGALGEQAKPMIPRMIRVFERKETQSGTKYQLLVAFEYIGDKRALSVVDREMFLIYTRAFPPKEGETVHKLTQEEWEVFRREQPFWAKYLQQTNETYIKLEGEEGK